MGDTGAPHLIPFPEGPDPAYVHLDLKAQAEQVHARLVAADGRLTTVDADSGWQLLTLSAGFSSVTSPVYRIMGQTVYLGGVVQLNTGSVNTPIATLPVAARPARQQTLGSGVTGDGTFDYLLIVQTTGGITIPAGYTNGTANAGEVIPLFGSFLLG